MIYNTFILPNVKKYESKILQAEAKIAQVAAKAEQIYDESGMDDIVDNLVENAGEAAEYI